MHSKIQRQGSKGRNGGYELKEVGVKYVRPLSHSSILSRRENWPDLSFMKTPLMDALKERGRLIIKKQGGHLAG